MHAPCKTRGRHPRACLCPGPFRASCWRLAVRRQSRAPFLERRKIPARQIAPFPPRVRLRNTAGHRPSCLPVHFRRPFLFRLMGQLPVQMTEGCRPTARRRDRVCGRADLLRLGLPRPNFHPRGADTTLELRLSLHSIQRGDILRAISIRARARHGYRPLRPRNIRPLA